MGFLSESWKLDAITLLAVLLSLYYVRARRAYTYWERNGFKTFPDVSYLFGHFKTILSQKEFAGELVTRLYKSTNEPFIGIYSILRPVLLVRDPELIRSILIKDFSYFLDRGIYSNEEADPISVHLFSAPGQKWKNMRSKLTPTFTSGKLKAMFTTLVDCGQTLGIILEKISDKKELFDVREIAASHTTNIIASVAFGIDTDALQNPNNEFRVCGRKIFESSIWNSIRLFFFFMAPKMMGHLRIRVADKSVENFIKSVVKQNLEHREKNNIVRKDFFQLLIQLRNTGTVQLDDQWETVIKGDESQKALTVDEMAAQTFVFFMAGFETSSTTLAFCMYELARHPEIQRRVHEEIDEVLAKYNDEITYKGIMEMKYLEACMDETLRIYPILPIINRKCVKNYKIPGTDKVIEEGVNILIPSMALQRDEKYYKHPERFDPNRFLDDNTPGKNFVNQPYLAFGDGPRNCIGLRLGKMQTKVGMVMMLRGFRFELQDEMKNREMKFDPKIFITSPLQKIQLRPFKR